MAEINNLMEDIAIDAFEKSIGIASLALISDTGKIIYQTKNWDLLSQATTILDVVNGNKQFMLNDIEFSVTNTDPSRFVGQNESGMGSVLIIPMTGAIFIAYAIPGATAEDTLDFLQSYTQLIIEKL